MLPPRSATVSPPSSPCLRRLRALLSISALRPWLFFFVCPPHRIRTQPSRRSPQRPMFRARGSLWPHEVGGPDTHRARRFRHTCECSGYVRRLERVEGHGVPVPFPRERNLDVKRSSRRVRLPVRIAVMQQRGEIAGADLVGRPPEGVRRGLTLA